MFFLKKNKPGRFLSITFDRSGITLVSVPRLISEDEQQTDIRKVGAQMVVFTARVFVQTTSAQALGGIPTGKAAACEF